MCEVMDSNPYHPSLSYPYVYPNNNWRRVIPILTPALKEGSCEEDFDLQTKRFGVIAIAGVINYIAIMCFAVLSSPFFIGGLVSLCALPIILLLDHRNTSKGSDTWAVAEYEHMQFPSKQATYRILNSVGAARLFTKKHCDPDTKNGDGRPLFHGFHPLPKFEVFKWFLNTNLSPSILHSLLQLAVEDDAYLEYLLQIGKITPSDVNENDQFTLWKHAKSKKSMHLLKTHGFNVNARNTEGYTPFLIAVLNFDSFTLSRDLGNVERITTLLNCGADPNLTVSIKKQGQEEGSIVQEEKNARMFIENLLKQQRTPYSTSTLNALLEILDQHSNRNDE